MSAVPLNLPLDFKVKAREQGLYYVSALLLHGGFTVWGHNYSGCKAAMDFTFPVHLRGGYGNSFGVAPVVCSTCGTKLGECIDGAFIEQCSFCFGKRWSIQNLEFPCGVIAQYLKISIAEVRKQMILARLAIPSNVDMWRLSRGTNLLPSESEVAFPQLRAAAR